MAVVVVGALVDAARSPGIPWNRTVEAPPLPPVAGVMGMLLVGDKLALKLGFNKEDALETRNVQMLQQPK